jgi:hypothetical protein
MASESFCGGFTTQVDGNHVNIAATLVNVTPESCYTRDTEAHVHDGQGCFNRTMERVQINSWSDFLADLGFPQHKVCVVVIDQHFA